MTLRTRWLDLVRPFASPEVAAAAWSALDNAYGDSLRWYHNWEHLTEMLDGLSANFPLAAEPRVPVEEHIGDRLAVELAIWAHDIVYDVTRPDNEERSAQWLEQWAKATRLPAATVARAAAHIRATAGHAPTIDVDTRWLLDLDLATLGMARARYERYAIDVRTEYAQYADAEYRVGRRRVIAHFLELPRIYQTETLHAQYETAARANLTWEWDFWGA